MQNVSYFNGLFTGGPIYKKSSTTINDLKTSGFNTVIAWLVHINKNGDLNLNMEFLLAQDGQYVGQSTWPNFQNDITDLKQSPTSVSRFELSLGSSEGGTFESVTHLVNLQGTGPDSILYKNFAALKKAIPEIDAINYDDEHNYQVDSTVKLSAMLSGLGFKVTLCPYENESFWTDVASQTNSQKPDTIDSVYLQCYAGGGGNNPCNWNFSGIPVYSGLWCKHGNDCAAGNSPDEVENQLNDWKNQCNITGGWMWLYDDMLNCTEASQYASAIKNVFGC